jgi:hypothetical protein
MLFHYVSETKPESNIKQSVQVWNREKNTWGQNRPKKSRIKMLNGQAAFGHRLLDTKVSKKECNRPTGKRP